MGRLNDKPAKLDGTFQQVNDLLSPYLTLAAATKAQWKTPGVLTLSAHEVKSLSCCVLESALHKTLALVMGMSVECFKNQNSFIKNIATGFEIVTINSP